MAADEEDFNRTPSGRVRKRRKDGWKRRDERVFLKHYRATLNVCASARAAGKSPSSAYDLRDRDPAFRAAWDATMEDARVRVHGTLIAFAETRGKALLAREDGEPGEPDTADFDPELALKLLRYHEQGRAGARFKPPPPVSEEELTAAILHQLAALDRRLKKKRI